MEFEQLFTAEALSELFPPERADLFFEGLYGDHAEGAYDIRLGFRGRDRDTLRFEFRLEQRQGKCLACNLTYGLPQVFSRHPVINIRDLVDRIDQMLGHGLRCADWRLGPTREISGQLHVVPLSITIAG
ncbi:MAG: pancreas/duodenum homeobox protein 1 [Deltaproteobacteria bacterium]|nr:pancreas/duodenum homeobox protein 1 [Deltaproteobacteria bacterium]MBW2048335.1 pancreas/duodenum homeobox protein 1 [Deltaproteobacteria bacterium]MBW2112248.1 pancreas/duodenum homeobox protein 1 [Deltaproteobacteria bacterium]MBW2352784.1 pancreas/duodenum homeobox protein 1 [Deltaproteobacteria bacterium]